MDIRLQPGERYEDLYQRILAFFEDNLITTSDNLKHHGSNVTQNEELTPTLENNITLLWLERIHIGLPGLVKQKYGAELRNNTLATIKSEINLALSSLVNELNRNVEDSRIMKFSNYNVNSKIQKKIHNKSRRFCCLCDAARRPGAESHFLSQCKFLPEEDRQRMQSSYNRIRSVDIDDLDDQEEVQRTDITEDNCLFVDAPSIQRRVMTRKSPHLNCFYGQFPMVVCLDTGAESSLVSKRFAEKVGLEIHSAQQGAVQADVSTPLKIIGEIRNISIIRGPHTFVFDALVTENDFGDMIAGEPFLEKNDVAIRPSKKQIIVKGKDVIPYNV